MRPLWQILEFSLMSLLCHSLCEHRKKKKKKKINSKNRKKKKEKGEKDQDGPTVEISPP
jgi:hypothetical protein